MTEIERPPPQWILIVSGLIALLELGVSVALCMAPESVVDSVDLDVKGVDYLIYMWAARQFALGIVFGLATFKRSVTMLTSAYVFFLVMFIGDLAIGIFQKNTTMVISALVMCGISTAMLFLVNKQN